MSNKQMVSITPDSFDGDAADLLEHNLAREAAAQIEGVTIDDFVCTIREAPEWLDAAINRTAMRYSIDARQLTRALSERLTRPCSDPKLSLDLIDTYRAVSHHAYQSVNKELGDLLRIPSGFYFSPSDKYAANYPTLSVYGWAKPQLVEMARITGDSSWEIVALSNLCHIMLDFSGIPDGIRAKLTGHELRRQTFLKWRYNALLGFLPNDSPLWLKTEIESLIKRHPGQKFAEIARAVDFAIDTEAARRKLMRLLASMKKSGSLRLKNRRYYTNVD